MQKVIDLARERARRSISYAPTPGDPLERIGMTARQEPVDLRGVAADLLARDERRLVESGFTVEKYAREGDPAHTIIEVADENEAGGPPPSKFYKHRVKLAFSLTPHWGVGRAISPRVRARAMA